MPRLSCRRAAEQGPGKELNFASLVIVDLFNLPKLLFSPLYNEDNDRMYHMRVERIK